MREQPVDNLMRQAIAEKIFPGGVLLVSVNGSIIFFKAYGYANLCSDVPITQDTIFDLASLTKPLATALGVMILVQRKKIELDDTLGMILPEAKNTDKAQIKVKHLLYHNSGLPDYRPYYQTLSRLPQKARRKALRECLLKETLVDAIGQKVVYSDLGFMMLAWVIEHISGQRLDHFIAQEIYRPLGLQHLFFISSDTYLYEELFAATENCRWRDMILEGRVHDENAYAVGGIEGHAGLFGNAENIHHLLYALLSSYLGYPSYPLFHTALVRLFFKRLPHTDKTLGFDAPRLRGSSCGSYFSKNSVGHLGFTGTSFWMDLDRKMSVILLTNRIHPTRENNAIKAFRPELHDAVIKAI